MDNIAHYQYDKQSAFNSFLNNLKNNYSVISDIFFGFNEETIECLNCKNIYYNYNIFNCLIFPLEEIKNMKNNSFNNCNFQIKNNEVSLYDCFEFNQKKYYCLGEERYYCNICKQIYDSVYTSKIFVSPTVLVIILNRGKGNIYDVKLNFSETIDITQFVLKKDYPQIKYNLYGVITHIGQSGHNAHFVASCKSPIDNQWYRYNDSMVNLITNVNKEIINFGVPYILFYQKSYYQLVESNNSPTLIGLNNIGATCFINSTLQCLSQTKALANYFLNINNKEAIKNNNIALKNKNDYQLSPVFLDLIQKLWEKNVHNSFSPDAFMNTINNMNPKFKTEQGGDAKDFIIFILEQLHEELKKSIQSNSNSILKLNQYDKNNAFIYFFNEFKKENSIISDIFFGINETTNECLNCKKINNSKGYNDPICYNYGIFNCLIFPLEEVKNMKNKDIQKNNILINNNRISLYDCFYYNQKSEYFTGVNKIYCNACKEICDSISTSKIFASPTVLVIILDRGRGNIYDVKLDFNETIDITQFVQQKDSPQLIYNLYGTITHIGQSGPNAHFVASCKSPIDNQWYRYNDAFVTPITNLQKEVIEFGTPYILFYQKN